MRNSVRYSDWPVGRVAHAEDCKSLYIGSIPVPASKIHSLPHLLFRLSSAVEQSAVNRLVACSNQAAGAIKKHHLEDGVFLWLRLSGRAATNGSLFGADSWFKRACEVWILRREEDPLAGVPNLAAPCCSVEREKPVSFPPLSLQKNAGYNIRQIKALWLLLRKLTLRGHCCWYYSYCSNHCCHFSNWNNRHCLDYIPQSTNNEVKRPLFS